MGYRKLCLELMRDILLTICGQEYQENQPPITVDNVEISQTVNLYACKNTTVIVKGKCNAVTLSTSAARLYRTALLIQLQSTARRRVFSSSL